MPDSFLHRNPSISVIFFLLLLLAAGCSGKQQERSHEKQAGNKPRIVSLAPSVTEMIYAVGAGDQLIGRTSACDWPKEAEKVQVVGAFGKPSLEILASLHPDIVLDVDLADEQNGKKIEALGIRRERVACSTPDDIAPALRKIGQLTGHRREADSLAARITKGLLTFRKEAEEATRKPSVYLEIWDDPLWTGGKNSYTSALIWYAGGKNIGDQVEKEYFEISPEWVVKINPDIIACMYMSNKSSGAETVRNRAGWESINAVKNNRVYERFDNSLFLRSGPRVLEGIEQLQKIMRSE
ncbi:MAG: cobalamin-binding protein [Chlorobiaceae bacterium]|nr:cobalamin-binding protein [Chlorobiaceae bacterium]